MITALGLDHAAVAGLLERLRERGHTVACAESLTGGLLLAVLTTVLVVAAPAAARYRIGVGEQNPHRFRHRRSSWTTRARGGC